MPESNPTVWFIISNLFEGWTFEFRRHRSGFSTTPENYNRYTHTQQQQQLSPIAGQPTPTTTSKLSSTFVIYHKATTNGFALELFLLVQWGHLPQTFGMPCGSRMTWFRITITGRATMNWIFGWTHYELIVLQSIHIITVHTGRKLLMAISDKYRRSVLCVQRKPPPEPGFILFRRSRKKTSLKCVWQRHIWKNIHGFIVFDI